MDEAAIVALVARRFRGLVARGALGLVDDAALLPKPRPRATRVMSVDQMNEGVHFDVERGGVESAGWRAIVRNLSDLAAMGAKPVGFQWTLALPQRWLDDDGRLLDRFLRGAARACRRFGLPLLGGDLSSSERRCYCSVAILGDVDGAPLTRSGARAGHRLYVSRPLGASSRGLSLLLGRRAASSRQDERAVRAHLFPAPELALGSGLVGRASACMDVSDGLALDAARLARASGVAVELDERMVRAAVDDAARTGEEDGLVHALHGGDDYALLFALPRRARPPRGALLVGDVVRGKGVFLVRDGERAPLAPVGYEHFAKRGRTRR